nr:GNAT family protein [Bifidobacterium aemilianum]
MHIPVLQAPVGCPPIELRPFRLEDQEEWNQVRWANMQWLDPWQSSDPNHGPRLSYNQWIQRLRSDERQGTGAVFMIRYQMRMVGQISLAAISYGSVRSGMVGYWVDQRYLGRSIAPTALALLGDWALSNPDGPGLHRLEIAILPENDRSIRVVEKVGAHAEGTMRKYMYINDSWRDHRIFSIVAEDLGPGLVRSLSGRGR